MTHPRTALLLIVLGLSGCGGSATSRASPPLGRSLGGEPGPASQASTPTGDPPQERNGAVPRRQATAETEPAPKSLAPSPQIALRRYALAYTNWHASSLTAHERELASLAIGAARLVAEQVAASGSEAASLATSHVQNKGLVLAIARGQGPVRGQWVVVTQEQTTGTGSCAGLPSSLHVTLARTVYLGKGWAVSERSPRS
jgi:hypothetical protein